jgi:hypothetical protein
MGNRYVWLPGGAHAHFLTCREAPTRPIRAFRQGDGTGIPAILLARKLAGAVWGTGASQKTTPAPKTLSEPLWGAPVEMLLL